MNDEDITAEIMKELTAHKKNAEGSINQYKRRKDFDSIRNRQIPGQKAAKRECTRE